MCVFALPVVYWPVTSGEYPLLLGFAWFIYDKISDLKSKLNPAIYWQKEKLNL